MAKPQNTSTAKTRRSHNRIQPLLDASAKLFANKGYKETSMRDIGAEIGMLPGSVYYHFKSKQELLLSVYEQAVEGIQTRLLNAIAKTDKPWERLEVAVTTHVETILDSTDYARILIGVLPDKVPDIEAELIRLRDGYEQVFINIIDQLPLRPSVDKRLFRLMLFGAMNATQHWYQKGSAKPAQIASEYVKYLREPVIS